MKRSIFVLLLSLAWLLPPAASFSAIEEIRPVPTASSSDPDVSGDVNAQSSRALEAILQNSDGMTMSTFFETIWQQSPALFRGKFQPNNSPLEEGTTSNWNEQAVTSEPYQELMRQGWNTLTDLLEQPLMIEEPPMVIHEGHVQHPQDWMPAFQTTSLFAPYLNGSSVMQAHADCLSPWLAAFCNDLQRTFPYVYANTYLTPPQSRALNLHADDRDVLVVQLVGSKQWQVMKEVPIPYPYPHEQVGKADLAVPEYVLEAGPALTCTLEPGDVLYIPRGHCHQAKCTDDLSFHVTIAVATFDWSLAGMIHLASKSILASVPEHKKGILPQQALGSASAPKEALQAQIDDALQLLQKQITPDAIWNNLQARIEPHRQRAQVPREQQLERARANTQPPQSAIPVGPLAARHIRFQTRLRAATAEEQQELQKRPPLLVRDELKDDVASILAQLQTEMVSLAELKSTPGRSPIWCDLAWLGLAKKAVEAGLLAVVD